MVKPSWTTCVECENIDGLVEGWDGCLVDGWPMKLEELDPDYGTGLFDI